MIRTDSRKVQPGDTFVALPGISSNGDQYIKKAVEAGAVCIVCRPGAESPDPAKSQVSYVFTEDPRSYLEDLLVKEYGYIIDQMTLIAVTGTNGKTTTCYLIAQALNKMGRLCGYIGTIGFYLGEKVRSLPNTSVDICDLYELLLESYEKGFRTVALEASSQGLDLGRLHTLSFDLAVFTNLTEDHLDYHKTMDNYAQAKLLLFQAVKKSGAALINGDDPWKDLFLLKENRNYLYGVHSGNFRAETFRFGDGTDLVFSLEIPAAPRSDEDHTAFDRKICRAHTSLLGEYNVYNTMAVIGTLSLLGYSSEEICRGIQDLKAPDGRLDVIRFQDSNIVIDYAHTPDAVIKVMETARGFTSGNMYVIFGCTGDREREKRPVMTQLVLSGCTWAIITDDDVHTEPEQQIVDDMLAGNTYTNYEICLDRKQAIRKGIDLLQPGDSLLILGKGHEEFIIMNGYKIPHNDRREVLACIDGKDENS